MVPPQANGDFVAAMERVLDVFWRPAASLVFCCLRPKHGTAAGLNVAEVKLNVMISQRLNSRIDSIKTLRSNMTWHQLCCQPVWLL